MNRQHVSWSNFTDSIEGPCAVCGQPVQFLLPADRPSPAFLTHGTCDIMPVLREKVKAARPAPLPADQTIRYKNGVPPAAEAPAPTAPAATLPAAAK